MHCFEFMETVSRGLHIWAGSQPMIRAYINELTPTCILGEELAAFVRLFPPDAEFILEQATLIERDGYVVLDRRRVRQKRESKKDDRALVLLQSASTGSVWWRGDPSEVRPVTAMQRRIHFAGGEALEHLVVMNRGASLVVGRSGRMDAACPRFFDLQWDGQTLRSKSRGEKWADTEPRTPVVANETAAA